MEIERPRILPSVLPDIRSADSWNVTKLIDEMGKLGRSLSRVDAVEAVGHGWADAGLVKVLSDVAGRWGDAVGVLVPVSFSNSRGGGVREGELNFTEVFAEDVLRCPDLICGHEAAHVLEHARLVGNEEIDNHYLHPYVREGFEHGRHRMPPFSLTDYHQRSQGGLFRFEYPVAGGVRSLSEDVGYNARQIFCDSVPFKEVLLRDQQGLPPILDGLGQPVGVDSLARQYLKYMEGQYDSITEGGVLVGPLPKSQIPVVSRFGASTWALEYLVLELDNSDRRKDIGDSLASMSAKFLHLFKHPLLGSKDPVEARDTPISDMVGPKRGEVEKLRESRELDPVSGLTYDEALSIIVLIRAYKRHFRACISRGDMIADDDLAPHFERLVDGTPSQKVKVAHLLGELGSVKALDSRGRGTDLMGASKDTNPQVADAASEAAASIVSSNYGWCVENGRSDCIKLTADRYASDRSGFIEGGEFFGKLLNNPNSALREQGVRAHTSFLDYFGGVDQFHIPAVINLLGDESETVRGCAHFLLLTLTDMDAPDMLPPLITALSHENDNVKAGAASVLRIAGGSGEQAFPALVKAYTEGEGVVRQECGRTLFGISEYDPKLRDDAVDILTEGGRHEIIDALRSLKPKEYSPPFDPPTQTTVEPNPEIPKAIQALTDNWVEVRRPGRITRFERPNILERGFLVEELGKNSASVLPALTGGYVGADSDVKMDICHIFSMAAANSKDAVPFLVERFKDCDDLEFSILASTVADIAGAVPSIVPQLEKTLQYPHNNVREGVFQALKYLHNNQKQTKN